MDFACTKMKKEGIIMNILLVCGAGMSTSLLVSKMQKEADNLGVNADIEAVAIHEVRSHLEEADVVMLGPQIRYKLKEVQDLTKDRAIPVEVINPSDYGMVNGKKVFERALALQKQRESD
jgi:PTS system cellobiose-specific IIB component